MSALSESHVGRYTEHNTKPDPHRHLVSCRTDGCAYTDTHRNPYAEIHFLAHRMCLAGWRMSFNGSLTVGGLSYSAPAGKSTREEARRGV